MRDIRGKVEQLRERISSLPYKTRERLAVEHGLSMSWVTHFCDKKIKIPGLFPFHDLWNSLFVSRSKMLKYMGPKEESK